MKKLISLGASLLILAGCASVPTGDLQRDAELQTFSAPQETAAIYPLPWFSAVTV
ncbi:hypothetical protein [Burkholderia perseverans]|uniref:hypothetical protein n=1 Tax=Burkholderia perseverans TaxID=2615214 RepID=UPI001FEFE43D|nr:hypothetical protein [Burkholderia perseverans]